MNKLNTFFRTLYLSFTSPKYYADIIKAPLSFSFNYYFGFTFLFSLLAAGIITIRWIVPFSGFLSTLPHLLEDAYPEELTVTINNGQVSTNVKEPYFIPVSVLQPIIDELEKRVKGTNESDLQNILVIDTQADANDITTYSTWVLLTWDSVVYINDSGNAEIVSLKDVENVTITKESFGSTLNQITPLFQYFVPVVLIILLLGFIANGVFRLIYILFLACILWLIAKLASAPLKFGKAYQIGLHFNFIPYTLLTLLGLSGFKLTMPFLETAIQIILGMTIVMLIKPKTSH